MYTTEELKELASQLSKPNGNMGIEVAAMMEASNMGMTMSTIQALNLVDKNAVLELGHGNGSHINQLMNIANIHYSGLEISDLMHEEAKRLNSDFNENKSAEFYLYEGDQIPFGDDSFDKIFTVNTIYFWNSPQVFINEIYRVLKPGGNFCIGLAWKHFMQNLPFTPFGFLLYDEQMIQTLVSGSSFILHEIISHKEIVKSKSGEEMEREFAVVVLNK